MEKTQKWNKSLLAPFIIFTISLIIPQIIEIEAVKVYSVGILLAGLTMWIMDIFPMSVSTLFLICLLPILGIMDFNEAIASMGVNTSLFIMAASGVTIALSNSNLPKWIINYMLDRMKSNTLLMIFMIGYIITICSGFMSGLVTCALFYGIISASFKQADENLVKTNFYKALMLLIPACSGIGGFISPAGTPANILLLDIMANEGISISFYQWCMIGFPIAMIAATLFIFSLIFVLKPEKNIKFDQCDRCELQFKDKYTLLIVIIIVIGWFMSSWISEINITMVAVCGLMIMFIPQLDILNLENFQKGVNWDLVITMGTISVLMTGISKTGVLEDIVNSLFGSIVDLNSILLLIIISAAICVIRSFVPTATAVIALFTPIFISLSERLGLHPLILMMILAFWAVTPLLIIYTEPIYLITYKERVYTEKDLLKAGVFPSLLMSTVTVLLIPVLVQMAGI